MTPLMTTIADDSANAYGLFHPRPQVTSSATGVTLGYSINYSNTIGSMLSLDVFDLTNRKFLTTIPLMQYVASTGYSQLYADMVIDKTGKYIYLVATNSLFLIDAINLCVIGEINYSASPSSTTIYPVGIALHPSNNTVWVWDATYLGFNSNGRILVFTVGATLSYTATTINNMFTGGLSNNYYGGGTGTFNSTGTLAYFLTGITSGAGSGAYICTLPANASTGALTSNTYTNIVTTANLPSANISYTGAIAIDPTNTYIYYTTGNGTESLYQFNISTGVATLCTGLNSYLNYTNSGSIQFAQGKVYAFIGAPYGPSINYATTGSTTFSYTVPVSGTGGTAAALDSTGNYFWVAAANTAIAKVAVSGLAVVSGVKTPKVFNWMSSPQWTANVYRKFLINPVSVTHVYGETLYTVGGNYTWTCPSGVTSVSVVCVGGYVVNSNTGFQNSYFGNTSLVAAGGSYNGSSGPVIAGTGYAGGYSGSAPNVTNGYGAGGAAGYTAAGGYGAGINGTGINGTGTSAAGGGGGNSVCGYRGRVTQYAGGYGGGVGVYGSYGPTPYWNGTFGGNDFTTQPGTGGTPGSTQGNSGGTGSWGTYIDNTTVVNTVATSGIFGSAFPSYGAGALSYANNISVTPGSGYAVQVGFSSGAVRIIWPGTTRSFPSTKTVQMGVPTGSNIDNQPDQHIYLGLNLSGGNNYVGRFLSTLSGNLYNNSNTLVAGVNGANIVTLDSLSNSYSMYEMFRGSDSGIWFQGGNQVFSMVTGANYGGTANNGTSFTTISGALFNTYARSSNSGVMQITKMAAGPDGATMWLYDNSTYKFYIIYPGQIYPATGYYPTSTSKTIYIDTCPAINSTFTVSCLAMVAGADGVSMWVIDSNNNLYRYTNAGLQNTYSLSSYFASSNKLFLGPDNNIYVTGQNSGTAGVFSVLQVTPTGTITKFNSSALVPSNTCGTWALCIAPDGSMIVSTYQTGGNPGIIKVYTNGTFGNWTNSSTGSYLSPGNTCSVLCDTTGTIWLGPANNYLLGYSYNFASNAGWTNTMGPWSSYTITSINAVMGP